MFNSVLKVRYNRFGDLRMNIINKMDNKNEFSYSEQVIIDYILENKDEISKLTIHELALRTHTSNPAIIRLCKKLGVDGFRDFKIIFSRDLEKFRKERTNVDVNYPFKKDESISEVANNISIVTKSAVDLCYENLNEEVIKTVGKLLVKSKNIYLFAIGDSYVRALSFKNKLVKLKKIVLDGTSANLSAIYASCCDENDCAIFISYSSMNKEFLYMQHILKMNHTLIVTVTANKDSELAKNSDYLLTFPDLENPFDSISTFYSQIAIEYLLNILYSVVYQEIQN